MSTWVHNAADGQARQLDTDGCGTKIRTEFESDGKQLPFPAQNDPFRVCEITLCNFNHVKEYLSTHVIRGHE